MWGTSSPDDKLTGDLANAIEAISIDDRGSDCLAAGKLAPGNLGLFQQHRPSSYIRWRCGSYHCRTSANSAGHVVLALGIRPTRLTKGGQSSAADFGTSMQVRTSGRFACSSTWS